MLPCKLVCVTIYNFCKRLFENKLKPPVCYTVHEHAFWHIENKLNISKFMYNLQYKSLNKRRYIGFDFWLQYTYFLPIDALMLCQGRQFDMS